MPCNNILLHVTHTGWVLLGNFMHDYPYKLPGAVLSKKKKKLPGADLFLKSKLTKSKVGRTNSATFFCIFVMKCDVFLYDSAFASYTAFTNYGL